MGDVYPRFKAGSVMASPVFLDRDATTEKACGLIAEAAGAGARLIVFPEVYVPGYPYWIYILQRLADRSRPFGTTVAVLGDTAEIKLKTQN